MKRHSDGRAPRDGGDVCAEDFGKSHAVGARGLRADNVLRVLETHSEKYLAVPGPRFKFTHTPGAAERVNF